MASARRCDFCDQPYIAKNSRSRFCSDRCRADNGGAKKPPATETVAGGGTTAALVAELAQADLAGSPVAQAALVMAARIDSADTPPSAIAALMREFRAARVEILAGAAKAKDPLDEMRARRDAKYGRASAG